MQNPAMSVREHDGEAAGKVFSHLYKCTQLPRTPGYLSTFRIQMLALPKGFSESCEANSSAHTSVPSILSTSFLFIPLLEGFPPEPRAPSDPFRLLLQRVAW